STGLGIAMLKSAVLSIGIMVACPSSGFAQALVIPCSLGSGQCTQVNPTFVADPRPSVPGPYPAITVANVPRGTQTSTVVTVHFDGNLFPHIGVPGPFEVSRTTFRMGQYLDFLGGVPLGSGAALYDLGPLPSQRYHIEFGRAPPFQLLAVTDFDVVEAAR